jgi:LysM repeat protein
MPQNTMTNPYLVMLRGSQPFRVFPLRKTILTIGRAPNNDIVIMDRRVSRHHARLTYQQGDWLLEDLNSDNGVWVNGIKIVGPTFVADDSIISLGQSVNFELELKPDPPPDVPQRKFLPGWVRVAGLFGIGGVGLAIIGAVLLAILGALAYFAFGFGGGTPWIEVEWTQSQPAEVAQIADADQPVEAGGVVGAIGDTGAMLGVDAFPVRGPEVTIQEPLPGLFVPLGGSFPVQAAAYDAQGVVRVDLWVDDQLALSQTVKPGDDGIRNFFLSQGMLGTNEGTFALVVRAYNAQGVMGESPAYYVTVSEDIEPEPIESFHYVVQEGDNLALIADDTGVSQQEIKDANPGMDEVSGVGQIISLPNPLMGAIQPPPDQPPSPDQAPLVGLNPVVGLNSVAAGQVVEVQPDLLAEPAVSQVQIAYFPDPAQSQNLAQDAPPAPTDLKAQVSDCKVTLQWKYGSQEASNLFIYRRYKPGQAAYQHIAVVPPNTTGFTDSIGMSGEYEYVIEAAGGLKATNPDINPDEMGFPSQKWTMKTSRSLPLRVKVNPSGGCVQDPAKLKVLYFQPITFSSHNTDVIKANIWYALPGSISRRIPPQKNSFLPVGSWRVRPELVPITNQIYLNPDTDFYFGVWSQGESYDSFISGKPPVEMGDGFISIFPKSIENKPNKTMNLFGDQFALEFKLWSAEQTWTGLGYTVPGSSSAAIPAPTDLREHGWYASKFDRILDWKWSGDPKTIDGFILYRTYSCPGQKTVTHSPLVLLASIREVSLDRRNEPTGCAYKYQVSAYGRYGESAVSNAVEGQTQSLYTNVKVTFLDLTISGLPTDQTKGEIVLAVNQFHRQTDPLVLQTGRTNLSGLLISGDIPNNTFVIDLGDQEGTWIHYYVNQIKDGQVLQGGICKGSLSLRPPDQWESSSYTEVVKALNGGPCKLTVEFSKGASSQPTSGETITHQADLQILNVVRVGQNVYAEISNRGPDDLTRTNVKLLAYSGRYCEETGVFSTEASLSRNQTWSEISAGSSVWMYISINVDSQVNHFLHKPETPKEGVCPRGLNLKVEPGGLYLRDSYEDPNDKNNEFNILLSSIKARK